MDIINSVLLAMQDSLNTEQLQKLRSVLTLVLARGAQSSKDEIALSLPRLFAAQPNCPRQKTADFMAHARQAMPTRRVLHMLSAN